MKRYCVATLPLGKRRRHGTYGACFTFAGGLIMAVTLPVLAGEAVAPTELPASAALPAESKADQASGEIYVVGAQDAFESLRDVIGRDRVGPIAVHWFQLDRLAPETLLAASGAIDLKVRCWIDLSLAGKVSLYFADRSSERFLMREVAVSKALTELEKEALAQVVEMSIVALVDDATLGISRANVKALLLDRSLRAPAPEPIVAQPLAPLPSPRTFWRTVASINYALEAYSPQIPWVHGPGATLGIARHSPGLRTSFALRVGYQLPEVYRTDLTGIRLSAARLRSNLMFDVPLASGGAGQPAGVGASFGMFLSAGANVVVVEPLQGNANRSLMLEPARAIAVAVLGAGCRATQPFDGWSMSLGAYADVDLERVSYDIKLNGALLPLVRSHSVRSGMVVELGWP